MDLEEKRQKEIQKERDAMAEFYQSRDQKITEEKAEGFFARIFSKKKSK